tara:strand:+ start:4764 stop:5570 length:807 start_codon:yes stop_codon:yes gene_type:complete
MSPTKKNVISSEAGLLVSQNKQQVEFFEKGFLILDFGNKRSLKNLLYFISNEVEKFNKGERSYWKQTFLGAFDMTNDELLVDFIKKNELENIINKISNQEYVLADAKLRMWTPRAPYLSWHRDTSIEKNGKVIGKIPPDINIFFYPKLNYKITPQLYLIEKSHRQVFTNKLIKNLQILFGKRITKFNDDKSFILFDSSILHGLPKNMNYLPAKFKKLFNEYIIGKFSKKVYYPRLILRFCAKNNIDIYNRGTNLKNENLPSFNNLILR